MKAGLKTMSLIMKFKSVEDREKFLALVRRAKPDLVGKLASSPLLPHLHAHTDAKSDAWLRKQIGPFGEAFEDLQFKTFASEGGSGAPRRLGVDSRA